MKLLLALLLTTSQAFAGFPPTTASGQGDTTKPTTFNYVVPYNQSTITGSSTALFESGNHNLLKNPNFEALTASTSWEQFAGSVFADETINVFSGKKALKITLTAATAITVSQATVNSNLQLAGNNVEASIAVKTALTTLQVCPRKGATTITTNCATVVGDSQWHVYSVNLAGEDNIAYGVTVIPTASTTGVLYVDSAYVGPARNLGGGIPNNVFSAKISATGVVSDENEDFINGNCSISGGASEAKSCTFNTGKFLVAPNCTAISISGGVIFANLTANPTTTTVVISTANNAGGSAQGVNLVCTRSGSDFIQPTITAQNWNYNWKSFTPVAGTFIKAVTTAPTFGTILVNSAMHRRVGGNLELIWNFRQSTAGTAGSGAYLIDISQLGLQIDTTNLPANTSVASWTDFQSIVGTIYFNDGVSAGTGIGPVAVYNSTQLKAGFQFQSASTGFSTNTWGSTFGSFIVANKSFTVHVSIPIVGWSDTQNAPQLVGSVTSNATGALRIESAVITGAGVNGSCSTTPCTITSKSSDWLSSVSRSATGQYSVNFNAGIFSTPPTCTHTPNNNSVSTALTILTAGIPTTSLEGIVTTANGVLVDAQFNIICMGAR